MAGEQAAEALGRFREEFFEEPGAAFDQVFGQDGKNGLATFTQREDRVCEATDALARWMVQKHLVWDEAKEPGEQVDCPICGGPVRHEFAQQAAVQALQPTSRLPQGADRAKRSDLRHQDTIVRSLRHAGTLIRSADSRLVFATTTTFQRGDPPRLAANEARCNAVGTRTE